MVVDDSLDSLGAILAYAVTSVIIVVVARHHVCLTRAGASIFIWRKMREGGARFFINQPVFAKNRSTFRNT
jgi:hypothetical protein